MKNLWHSFRCLCANIWSRLWVKILAYGSVSLLFIGLLSGIGLYIWVARDLPSIVDLEERRVAESSRIYDSSGDNLLYEISGDENRQVIEKDRIPEHVKNAFIAAEDRQFYEHFGIYPQAIMRAAWANIQSQSISQGASTITQQFIKNALLTSDKKFMRKAREALLAIQMEQRYSKDKIITMYLNEISFGGQIYGIESASQTFFGKNTSDLDIHEAAMLAAMIQRPSYFSPYGSNFDHLKARQQWVLSGMKSEDLISAEEYQQAKEENLVIQPFSRDIKAPHFVFYIREQVANRFGEEALEKGGLEITTTLDWELQELAQKVVEEELPAVSERYDGENAALGAVNPKTGGILAMVGSKDYFASDIDGNVNILTSEQSPGSSIKPLIYASAFEKGYHPETYVFDLKTDFELEPQRPPYEPENYNKRFNGPIRFREALGNSLNIPAIKALYLAGIDDTQRLGYKLGISDFREDRDLRLPMAIGGSELQLIEQYGAFAAFANDGRYHELTGIKQITNSRGEVLYQQQDKGEQILEPQTTRQLNDILSDNNARLQAFGRNNRLQITGHEVAAKTGTSQEYRDALTIGYTPNFLAGVWVGNNDNSPMNNGAGGSQAAGPIWNRFMQESLDRIGSEPFPEAKTQYIDKPMLDGDYEDTQEYEVNTVTGNIASENTPPELVEAKEFTTVNNILHYVNKDNPRGKIPDNPENDPMYERWQKGVEKWAQTQEGKYNEEPPQEQDNDLIYSDQNKPEITIKTPEDGETITSSSATLSVDVDLNHTLEQVDVYVDGESLFSRKSKTFSENISFTKDGEYTILVRAFDQYLNRSEKEIILKVKLPDDSDSDDNSDESESDDSDSDDSDGLENDGSDSDDNSGDSNSNDSDRSGGNDSDNDNSDESENAGSDSDDDSDESNSDNSDDPGSDDSGNDNSDGSGDNDSDSDNSNGSGSDTLDSDNVDSSSDSKENDTSSNQSNQDNNLPEL